MQVGHVFTVYLFIYFLFDCINETVLLQTDPCPKTGSLLKEWYEPGCTKCNCVKNGFECYSCGSSHIFTRPDCYLHDKAPHANYPLCCEKETICKGDPGFEGKLLEVYKTYDALQNKVTYSRHQDFNIINSGSFNSYFYHGYFSQYTVLKRDLVCMVYHRGFSTIMNISLFQNMKSESGSDDHPLKKKLN